MEEFKVIFFSGAKIGFAFPAVVNSQYLVSDPSFRVKVVAFIETVGVSGRESIFSCKIQLSKSEESTRFLEESGKKEERNCPWQ